ncbi:TadE family type IV pilus minor pilin [Arthrobacter sp. zg-Y1219]|uniref:TadE family type IV pilus minor pilin n=1 Tax=Arthrobacter sp. zg-Y1219 TaxID=3049067 RepID=UPI0024C40632|nr:TadE family type IV pilus minor pilin [Arthrobacter sp. zg-Y1219]MDK1359972.1 TadE family type IV pilus minor pilin [Arthrobacter sp. zg-Y1219]
MRRKDPQDSSLGAVTAELAVGLPAVALLLAAVLTGVAAGVTQLRVEEAARAAAREVMRGDSAEAEAAARRIAGAEARVTISADGQWLLVEVGSTVAAPLLDRLPLVLTATATALPESLP